MFGRKGIVDYPVLTDFSIDLTAVEGTPALTVKGTMMESARVFHSLEVRIEATTILITVFASLISWKKGGSPDFQETKKLDLKPGVYDIYYSGYKGQKTFIKKVQWEIT